MKNWMYRMTMWYIACLLTALVSMTGCKTTAPETTQSDQKDVMTRQEQMELFATMEENMNASLQQTSAKWSEQLWNINAQWNRTIYTPPDSTGKQYVQSEERIESNSSGKSQQKDTVYVDFRYDAIRQEFLQINSQMDELRALMKHMASEKKSNITWFQAALQFLGVCAIIYTIYRVFIRKSP